MDLKPVIGAQLYYDLLNKFDDIDEAVAAPYVKLIEGDEYTITEPYKIVYEGLAPMLAYYTLARFIQAHPLKYSRFNIVKKTTQNSEQAGFQEIQAEVKALRSSALNYQNEALAYLKFKATTFPAWNSTESRPRRTAYNFFKL